MIEKSGDKMMKMVYFFDEGDGKNKKLLGGKGAGLAEMTRLKLPVPPGFTITTDVCKLYYQNNKTLPKSLWAEVKKNIARLEKKTGKKWTRSRHRSRNLLKRPAQKIFPKTMKKLWKNLFGSRHRKNWRFREKAPFFLTEPVRLSRMWREFF